VASSGVEGMGYAISISEAMPLIQQLINSGYVVRPYMGVGSYTVDQFVIQRYNLAVAKGAFITNVAPGSPADKAGIKAGDVVTSLMEKTLPAATIWWRASGRAR
jgi:serine protease Do